MVITDSNKPLKQQTALYYQFPGDAIIMSGTFNLDFWHAVPAVESWKTLLHGLRTVRRLPEDKFAEANKVFQASN